MFFFFCLKFLLLISGMFVVTVISPVHSVLLLVCTFCCAAALLLLLGVDFLAFVFVLVYIGAIAVLFLFVVMMLNLRSHHEDNETPDLFSSVDPQRLVFILILLFLALEFSLSFASLDTLGLFQYTGMWIYYVDIVDPMRALGVYLYILFFFAIFLLGAILLVSMIGSILYTLKHSSGIKRQEIYLQTGRSTNSAYRCV